MSDDSEDAAQVPWLVSTAGLLVLCFIGGAVSAEFGVFPYPQLLKGPLEAAAPADRGMNQMGASSFPMQNWQPTGYSEFGTVRHEPDESAGGPVFYTSGHKPSAILVSRQGELLHKWEVPFAKVWPDPDHVEPASDQTIYWEDAHLYPNGDVLAVYSVTGKTVPYGYGVVKVDKNSEVIWRRGLKAHGGLGLGPGGDIYVLTHRLRNVTRQPIAGLEYLNRGTLLDDSIVRLSANGAFKERISLLEAFEGTGYEAALEMFPTTLEEPAEQNWDPLHPNDIDVVGEAFAGKHDFAEAGQLLVSFRTLDAVGLLDVESGKLRWMSRGSWWQQSDPDALENGNMLLFDANGHHDRDGPSKVIEFDPRTGATKWSYTGTPEAPFWSMNGGSQQRLDNGNTLITSRTSGRILEVTPEGRVVWEYRNPVHGESQGVSVIATIQAGRRVSPDMVSWLK